MNTIKSAFWWFVARIMAVLRIKCTSQYPPRMAQYPDYFTTKWYSCPIGRIIRNSIHDNYPRITYIIGNGPGYTNSFTFVLRRPSKKYRNDMGGWLHAWLGRNRCWQHWHTPLFSIRWSIAPRNSRWFKWLEFDGVVSSRNFSVRLFIANKMLVNLGFSWGGWTYRLWQRYKAWQRNRKYGHGPKCYCDGCVEERRGNDDNGTNYNAGYQYAAGYHD